MTRTECRIRTGMNVLGKRTVIQIVPVRACGCASGEEMPESSEILHVWQPTIRNFGRNGYNGWLTGMRTPYRSCACWAAEVFAE